MSRYKAEYLAGLFDGEGFVSVMFNPKSSQWYIPVVGITMRGQEDFFEDIAVDFGGNVQFSKYTHWRVTGINCIPFIEFILPHCFIKKSRLELTLELANTFHGLRGKSMTKSVLNKRKELVKQIRPQQEKGRTLYNDGTEYKRV